jgi:hypothetical protein
MRAACRSGKKIFTFFLLYYFLFAQYLYVDEARRHISMVVGNAMSNVIPAHHCKHDSTVTTHHRQHDSSATTRHGQRRLGSVTLA